MLSRGRVRRGGREGGEDERLSWVSFWDGRKEDDGSSEEGHRWWEGVGRGVGGLERIWEEGSGEGGGRRRKVVRASVEDVGRVGSSWREKVR